MYNHHCTGHVQGWTLGGRLLGRKEVRLFWHIAGSVRSRLLER